MKQKKSIFETLEAEVVKEAGAYVKDKVQKKILRISEISMLIVLGFFLISFGLATFIATQFPSLPEGISFILLGLGFLVISYVLKI